MQRKRAAIRHCMKSVDNKIDDNLLQLRAIHQHQPGGAIVPDDFNLGFVQQMPDKRQCIRNDAGSCLTFDIARILFRFCELQQLCHNLADAMDLLVKQTEFRRGEAHLFAADVAYDVRLPCITAIGLLISCATPAVTFANCSQLFGNNKLLGCGFQLAVCKLKFSRALIHPIVQFFIPSRSWRSRSCN